MNDMASPADRDTDEGWLVMVGSNASTGMAARPQLRRSDHVLAVVFGLWMVIGLFLDGWAHDNNKPESFFTVWHGVLYSGFVAAISAALFVAWRSRRPGLAWRHTLPQGHGLTLAALALFGAGAAGDLIWHEVFGIEVGVEALLSPTHLLLLVGGLVALSAPLRAAWVAPDSGGSLRSLLPALLSLALLTAMVGFFMMYLSPYSNDAAGHGFVQLTDAGHSHPANNVAELQQLLGIASILMTSVLLAIPAHLVLRRWVPPRGTFVLLFGVVGTLLVGLSEFAQPLVLLAGPLGGVTIDQLVRRVPAVISVAAGVVVLWLAYFALYALQTGAVQWSAELWAGTTFLAGLVVAGIGLLALPLPSYAREPGTSASIR